MKIGIPPLVIGNWKMNPQSATLSAKLATALKKTVSKIEGVEVVIAPPTIYLSGIRQILGSNKVLKLGAQNVHHEKLGAYTGETSLPMLQSFDVTHVIIGHSERRAEGETDEMVNQKLCATIKQGIVGVVCVGEAKRDHGGHYLSHIEAQIHKAFAKISKTYLEYVVVAYEPLWAIGTGTNATSADVHEMRLFIERVLTDMYGRNFAQKVRVLYGGSVTGKNARELFVNGTVNGFLVGGASLHADEFIQIVKAVQFL